MQVAGMLTFLVTPFVPFVCIRRRLRSTSLCVVYTATSSFESPLLGFWAPSSSSSYSSPQLCASEQASSFVSSSLSNPHSQHFQRPEKLVTFKKPIFRFQSLHLSGLLMDRQPKTEPGSPPGFGSSNHSNLSNMNIRELVSVLRAAFKMEDFDSVEEVLLSRDERLNAEIRQLREKVDMERLTRFHAEEEFRKREELCEKGKRVQESYERLLKDVKQSGLAERDTIAQLRKNNGELECEVRELKKVKETWIDLSNANTELRKRNGELESEVHELKKLKEKWVDDNNALTELRSRIRVLEDHNNTLAALEIEKGELEEEVKKNLDTIDELRNENRKLADEKCKHETRVESLNRKFEELQGRVVRLEDDTNLLISVGNNEEEPPADVGVTTFEDKDEEDVGDYEFGNDTVEPDSLQRNEGTGRSLGVAGTAQPPSKGSKDAQVASSARGKLELKKDIEVIDLEDDSDDDGCTSRGLHGKKAVSGITVKNEHPSLSVTGKPKSIFRDEQKIEMIKRKFSFSDCDTSTSSSSADDLPLSAALLHAKRKKT